MITDNQSQRNMTTHETLKSRQRKERHQYGEYLSVRVHRALSWLDRAEQCQDDNDAKVIFLWIAFNAAYANDIFSEQRPRECELFYLFLKRLCDMDDKNRLENIVWVEFTKSIRILLNNQYIYQPYWDYLNNKISEESWKSRFTRAKAAANTALGKRDTPKVLEIVLSRVYILRNQLIHGGSTWNSQVNRNQIRDYAKFMECLVPVVIEIMMDNSGEMWGQPCYPVTK